MSERNNGEVKYRKLDSSRRSGVVKSLVLEFEHLSTISADHKGGLLVMGSEQSNPIKQQNGVSTPVTGSKSLVKQRVNQFNVESESQSDKKRRHKSTSESSKNQNSKDFLRSVSVDVNHREKDRYSRSRQIAPKTSKDSDKLVNPHRKRAPSTDSNNNSQRKNGKARTNHDNAVKEVDKKKEKTANIKTNQRLIQRFNIPESTSLPLENSKDKTVNGNTKYAVKEYKPELTTRSSSKKLVRSVKSIKKVFDYNKSPLPRSSPANKIPRNNNTLSDSDTATATSDRAANKNNLYSNSHKEAVDNPSSNSDNEKQTFNNPDLETFSTAEQYLKYNENTNKSSIETYRKNIINNITEDYYLLENSGEVVANNYSEDEFNEIESNFQEMQQTIKEMEEHHSHNKLVPITASQTDDIEITSDQNHVINKEDLTIADNESFDEIENIKLYVGKSPISESKEEDEFGKRSFDSLNNISFTEAYNRDGNELIVTTVAGVEHRSISGNFTSGESLFSIEDDGNYQRHSTYDENVESSEEILPSENSISEQLEKAEDVDSESISKEINCSLYEEHKSCSIEKLQLADAEQEAESGVESNRSTIYSNANTNSTDSMEQLCKSETEVVSEPDKDLRHIYEELPKVEIRSNSSNGHERAIRTETFYDSFKNPRIAKITNIDSQQYLPNSATSTVEETERKETPRSPNSLKSKKEYVIEELIDTEKKYIKHLEKVVWDYMPVITDERLPPSLIGKSQYIFGNIKKIYATTQKFYKALRSSGNDHEEIAKVFLDYKHLFELYPLYSKNKPVADQYLLGDFKDEVTVRERQLNDRLGLASNLLTPIQRLGKYILFLEQIQKELQKVEGVASDNIYKAIETVRKQMSRGNDYIAIDSIKDSPISLVEQGSFIMREKFNVIKPRKYETMLFLFEKILVFTTVDPRNPEMFIYRESITLNEMGIVTSDQPLVFHLKRFPSYKKGPKEHHEFVIEAKKNKDKKTWTEQIEKRLWEQLVKCKEDQRELHSNQGKRNSVVDLPDRSRRKKTGYSSLPSEVRKYPPKSIFYYKMDRDA